MPEVSYERRMNDLGFWVKLCVSVVAESDVVRRCVRARADSQMGDDRLTK